ncbi:MAG: O-antigen/teichoic acid export membrane protein [Saprospiraceae bacterium]|jgi:O-antigen/teichoic acid export membrane protein
MLMVVFSYRLETAFFRFGTDKENRESAFSTALISILSSTLLFVGIMLFFSEFITTNILNYSTDLSIYVSMFALVLGFDVLAEIPFARLRLESRPLRFAAIKLTNIGLNVGLNLFFILLCPWILEQGGEALGYSIIEKYYNANFGVGYIFLSNLIASGVTILLLLPDFLRTTWLFDKALWKKMFLYSAPLILAGLAGIVNEVLDRQLLKYFLPGTTEENLAEIGIYGACYKLAMLLSLFTQAFRYAAEPFFFSQAKNKDAKLLYAEVGKYFAIFGLLGFLIITFYLEFFQYFVGEEYRIGLTIVPVLLLANLFLGLYYNLSVWYKLTDRTLYGGYIMSIGALITVVLNVLFIPEYGYMASACATLICYFTVTAISYYYGQKYYPVDYDLKRIFGYTAIAISLYLISVSFANFVETPILLAFNTLLLLSFLFILYKGEKASFQKFVM